MRRQTTYAGQVPLETDILNSNKNAFVALGHVLQDMLGTSTLFSGLGCVPTSPAGMTVNVNPGRAYSLQATDTGAWSSLSSDSHQIVKQGILLDTQNFSCPAPTTAGFSINYLIQGAFQEVDGGSTVLPYYNASNPVQAYNGPNGTGTSNTTYRDNTVQLQVKAGIAATTGSQITPTPDAGFNGLWVVTVAFGATSITSGNISQYSGAPFLTAPLLQMIQQNGLYAVATGTANAHVVALTPALQQRVDGMVIRYKAPAANTGALTLNDGLGAVSVVGGAHAALQGGETVTNGDVWVQWNSSVGGGSYVMLDSSGGALQIPPATQSQHAVQLGQLSSGTNITSPAQFDNSTRVPTTGWVNAVGLQYSPLHSGQATVTTLVTLDASYAGARIVFNNTANQSCTLPNPATWPNGGSLHLSKASSSQAGILTAGSFGATANIDIGSGLVSSLALQPGEDIFLVWSPLTSTWITAGTFFFRSNQFSSRQSLTGNGFQSLPGGLTLQWGSATITTSTSTITLPKAANAAILAVNITPSDAASTSALAVSNITGSLTSFAARSNIAGGIAVLWTAYTI